MLRFYFNHNVPGPIVSGLRRRQVDCLSAIEDGTAELPDPLLLRRATELGRPLFTMDDDFFAVSASFLSEGIEFSGVIHAHPLAITIGGAISDLELMAKILEPADMLNRVEHRPL